MDEIRWFEVTNYNPGVMFHVRFSDGTDGFCRWVCGSWETLDGEAVYPIEFTLENAEVHALFFPKIKPKRAPAATE